MGAKTSVTRTSNAEVVSASGPMTAAAVPMDVMQEAEVCIAVTVPGTTVTPVIESSPDGVNWFAHTTLTAIVAPGNVMAKLTGNLGRYLRINWTAVTGSFTLSAWING